MPHLPGEPIHPDDVVAWGLDPARAPWHIVPTHNWHDEFGFDIYACADGATLVWNDYVVNQWVEQLPSIAVAYARVACLLEAVEHQRWFTTDAAEFATDMQALFDRHMTPPETED